MIRCRDLLFEKRSFTVLSARNEAPLCMQASFCMTLAATLLAVQNGEESQLNFYLVYKLKFHRLPCMPLAVIASMR